MTHPAPRRTIRSAVKRLFLPLVPPILAGALLALPAGAQEEPRPLLFHTPARQAVAREPLAVEGLLVEGKRVDKVFLRFRALGEAFRTLEMEVQYGDLYRAVIPGRWVMPPAIEYHVQGVTFDGKPVPLYQSEKRPIRVRIVAEPPKAESPPAPLPREPDRPAPPAPNKPGNKPPVPPNQ